MIRPIERWTQMSNEQVWQFHVVDGHQFDRNGATYFAERAAQMANTLGCRLLNIKNIGLHSIPGGKWMVTGTAILQSAKADA
jgi:hypothetical protein